MGGELSGFPAAQRLPGFNAHSHPRKLDPSFVLAANFLPAVGERAFYSAEKWEAEANRFILGSVTLPPKPCGNAGRGGGREEGVSGGSRGPAPSGPQA